MSELNSTQILCFVSTLIFLSPNLKRFQRSQNFLKAVGW